MQEIFIHSFCWFDKIYIRLRNNLVYELATHSVLFFFYVNTMFIFFMSVALLAWSSRDSDIVVIFLLIFLCRERHLLLLYVAILGYADPWIFPFQHLSWVENSIAPVPRRLIFTALQWISRRPRSQNISKERALNPEKESSIKRPRSHVRRNHQKTISRWNIEPNQTSSLTSLHSQPTVLASVFGGFATWWSQKGENFLPFSPAKETGQGQGRGRGESRFDLAH